MKKTLLFALVFSSAALFTQTKTWKVTTASDFSTGTLNQLVSTTTSDGELRLIHPLVQVGIDTLDSSIPRFVGYDDAGNYVQGWVNAHIVYVQKFNSQRQAVSSAITVSTNAFFLSGNAGVALLNDGRFVITWVESLDSTNGFAYAPRYCQFFDASNAKVGSKLRIFNMPNATETAPTPIADQQHQRFLFVGTEGNSTAGFKLYGWLYSPLGIKLRDSIKIVPSSTTKNEYYVNGAFHNGKFALAWSGDNTGTSPGDSYFMLVDSNCTALTQPIRVNDDSNQGDSPVAAFGEAGNCCVAWRWTAGMIPGPPDVIYGRVFDFSGRAIGGVAQMTFFQSGGVYWEDISSVNGIFRLTYGLGFYNGVPAQQWASYRKVMPITSGSFISGIFDAGSQQTTFNLLSWNGSTPLGTRLKFQLRSSATAGDIQSVTWLGPSSPLDYYINASGEVINAAASGERYLQVKALFEADTVGQSAILNDFSITYKSVDTIAPLPVTNITAQGEHRRIVVGWNKSRSSDAKGYRVYRAVGGASFDPESFKELPLQTVTYIDSSVAFDTTYRYGISAIDSTFNESLILATESASPKAMNIYVSSVGTSGGDGSSLKPFSSIKDAITSSYRGDTVLVLPGEYTENFVMKEGTRLIGAGAAATKIISPNSDVTVTTAPHTVIQGFAFLVQSGILIVGDDVTISENLLLHQGSSFNVGIFSQQSYDRVVICKNFLMNFSLAIQIVGTPGPSTPLTVVRNNVIDGPLGAQNVMSNISFINNTFVITGSGAGISVAIGSTIVMNNCFAGYPADGGYIISFSSQSGNTNQFEYNDQWNVHYGLRDSASSTNISADPLFVNFAKNNFHLGGGSACINSGNPSAAYADRDGSRNDIGAYGGPDPMPEDLIFALATDLSLEGASAFPGDTVSVRVSLSRATGLKIADINIRFDPAIATFLSASTTPLTNGFSSAVSGNQSGKRSIHLQGTAEIPSGSGAVLTLRFKLNPSLWGEVHSAVEFDDAEFWDGENNRMLVSSVASGLIVVKSRASFPHRVYVDESNAGISDGTILRPYTTVQQGIANAKDGDTVFVSAGTYQGPVLMRSHVFVKGSGAAVTTIECPGDSLIGIPAVVQFNNVQNTGIAACNILNTSSTSAVIEMTGSDAELAANKIDQSGMGMYAVIVSSGLHVAIHDNYFVETKNGGAVMLVVTNGSAAVFRNLFSPSSAMNALMLGNSARGTVTNNRFILTQENMTGIEAAGSKHSLVANNLFLGSTGTGSGIKLADAESTFVINNVFDVRKTGIDENSGSQLILNNVFFGNAVGMNVSSMSSHRYNIFWTNGIDINNGARDPSEIISDPQFVDRDNGNYRPAAKSILRDGGDPGVQWNDHDGSRNDVGLYGGPYADTSMYAPSNMRLRIGSVPGAPGDTVTVPVIANGIVGMSGIQMAIEYDAQRLQLQSVETGSATRSFSLVRKNISHSLVTVGMTGSDEVVVDSAAVAELTMIVLPGATGTAAVKFQNVYVISAAAEMISVTQTENGIVDLTPSTARNRVSTLPKAFSLMQNFPNPFNPSTTLQYGLPVSSRVRLQIYNVLGQVVARLVNGEESAGWHQVKWTSNVSTGIYFYRIDAVSMRDPDNRFMQVRKMLLLK